MNLIAQIMGIIGLIVIVIGLQAKEKKHMLLAQTVTNICFVIQYFILGAITGAVIEIVNAIRTLTFYVWDKKELKSNIMLLSIFVILVIGFGIYTYKNVFSILPIFSSIAATYGGWQKSSKVMRIGLLASSSILMIHDLYFGAYAGVLTYLIIFSSTLIGMIRNDILKKNK